MSGRSRVRQRDGSAGGGAGEEQTGHSPSAGATAWTRMRAAWSEDTAGNVRTLFGGIELERTKTHRASVRVKGTFRIWDDCFWLEVGWDTRKVSE